MESRLECLSMINVLECKNTSIFRKYTLRYLGIKPPETFNLALNGFSLKVCVEEGGSNDKAVNTEYVSMFWPILFLQPFCKFEIYSQVK